MKIDPTVLAAIVSASVTAISVTLAYLQWRKDVRVKLGEISDTVSVELIKQRVGPYTVFMRNLEIFSSLYVDSNIQAQECKRVIQDAIFSEIGLLASHNTRQIMLYLRRGCDEIANGTIMMEDFQQRIWALHLALRSDIGIQQPAWDSVVERTRLENQEMLDYETTKNLIQSYPWNRIDYRNNRTLVAKNE